MTFMFLKYVIYGSLTIPASARLNDSAPLESDLLLEASLSLPEFKRRLETVGIFSESDHTQQSSKYNWRGTYITNTFKTLHHYPAFVEHGGKRSHCFNLELPGGRSPSTVSSKFN